MASPAKARKVGDDNVEGFIFNVSPRRQSKNNSPFFNAVIQSARQEYHRVVVFAMDKQATFMQAAKNNNAVRLRNVKRCISFSDPDGYDVLCSRTTTVDVTSLPFLPCPPPSCKKLTIAEVKALGPRQQVGEVCGKFNDHDTVSKVVSVSGSDCELKEIKICDGTGVIMVTLWDNFANATEATKSYSFKNVCTRERGGNISLSTGPSSIIEQIPDLNVPEDASGGNQQQSNSTALLSAVVKGIQVTIQRRCSSCRTRQKEFVEKSQFHRCESCKMKQSSLTFVPSLSGKAVVETDSGEHSVLISSALGTYLRGVGLCSLLNDAEAIEDHFLQGQRFDLTVNADGFLLSLQSALEPSSTESSASELSAPARPSTSSHGSFTQQGPPAAEMTISSDNDSRSSDELLVELLELAETSTTSDVGSGTSSI